MVSFTPRQLYPGIHWIGGWVNPRAGMDAVAKRRISAPVGNRTLVVQTVTYSLYWLSYPSHQDDYGSDLEANDSDLF
jgi:ABC-type taurine transport system ATPase subunit